MDFKVAGTAEFVTALQLDTKIAGIPADVLAAALLQAKEARLKILEVMQGAISAPRDEVRHTAPKIVSFEIPVDKIGEVIGPKGKVINTIQQETGADISVQDADGVGIVSIGSKDGAAVAEAQRRIELILDPPTAEVGAVYEGRVVNITKFGAFVNILPGRDGLIHISKLGRGKRIDRVEDVLGARRRALGPGRRHRPERQALALAPGRRRRRLRRRRRWRRRNASGPRDRDRESRAPAGRPSAA